MNSSAPSLLALNQYIRESCMRSMPALSSDITLGTCVASNSVVSWGGNLTVISCQSICILMFMICRRTQ